MDVLVLGPLLRVQHEADTPHSSGRVGWGGTLPLRHPFGFSVDTDGCGVSLFSVSASP